MLDLLLEYRELSGLDEAESLMTSMGLCSEERGRALKNIRRMRDILKNRKSRYSVSSIEALEKQILARRVFDDYFGTTFLRRGTMSVNDSLSRKLSLTYGMDESRFLYFVAAIVEGAETRSIIIESGVFKEAPGIVEKLRPSEKKVSEKTKKKALFNSAVYLLEKASCDSEARDLLFMLVSSLNIDPPSRVPSHEKCALMTEIHDGDRRIRNNSIRLRKLIKKGWGELLDEHGEFLRAVFSAPETDTQCKRLRSLIDDTIRDFIHGFGFRIQGWLPGMTPPHGLLSVYWRLGALC